MVRTLLSPRLARSAAWACVLLIAFLSLVPREMEIRTGFAPSLEHAFAYACTAGAFAWAYPHKGWWIIAVCGFAVLVLGALSSGRWARGTAERTAERLEAVEARGVVAAAERA
jgi:hypothetical protein